MPISILKQFKIIITIIEGIGWNCIQWRPAVITFHNFQYWINLLLVLKLQITLIQYQFYLIIHDQKLHRLKPKIYHDDIELHWWIWSPFPLQILVSCLQCRGGNCIRLYSSVYIVEIGSKWISTPGIFMSVVELIKARDIPLDKSGNQTRALSQWIGLLCSS